MMIQNKAFMFVLLFFYLFAVCALAAEKKVPAPTTAKSKAQPEQKSNPSAKGITDSAVKAGVKSCADRIYQVSDFLTTGLKTGAIFFSPPSDPDKRLVSFSLGLETPGGKAAYASESFAPNQANGCGSLYESVVYWEAGCPDVAKRQFPGFKNSKTVISNLIMLDGGTGVKVFLMPAGSGCVAIKKEVLN
jgi:hypothetical protein